MNLSEFCKFQARVRNYTTGNANEYLDFLTGDISGMISGSCLFLKYDHKLVGITIQGRAADYKPKDASLEKIIYYSALNKEVITAIAENNPFYSETDNNHSGNDTLRIWFVPVKPDPGFPVFAALSGSSLNEFMDNKALAEEILSAGWFIYEKHLETDRIKTLRAITESGGEKLANLHQSIKKKAKHISGFSSLISEKEKISAESLKYLQIIQSCSDEIISITESYETSYQKIDLSRSDHRQLGSNKADECKTILVVDNDDINFILIENFLKDSNVKLTRAYNG
jgi:hypothetical protein